jgi:tetratricopeptide (TPR) repeat protein
MNFALAALIIGIATPTNAGKTQIEAFCFVLFKEVGKRGHEACTEFFDSGDTEENAACASGVRGIDACTSVINSDRLKPDGLAIAHFFRSKAFKSKRLYKQQIQDLDETINHFPEHIPALRLRAKANERVGAIDKAILDLSDLIGLKPSEISLFADRGFLYSQSGQQEKAINDFNSIIQLDPSFAQGYFSRAISYDLSGQTDKAVADYTEAYSLGMRAPYLLEKLNEHNVTIR